jgi:AcrR family transcriptional regulator
VYLYYRSKREVYAAVLHRDLMALRDQTRQQVEAADGVEEKVRAFIATKLHYLDEHRDFFRIYFTELGRAAALRHPQAQRQLDEIYLDQVQLLEQVLQQAMKKRQVRHLRPDAAARAVFDLTRGVIAQRVQGWSRATLEEDVAFAFDFVWKGIALR